MKTDEIPLAKHKAIDIFNKQQYDIKKNCMKMHLYRDSVCQSEYYLKLWCNENSSCVLVYG